MDAVLVDMIRTTAPIPYDPAAVADWPSSCPICCSHLAYEEDGLSPALAQLRLD